MAFVIIGRCLDGGQVGQEGELNVAYHDPIGIVE